MKASPDSTSSGTRPSHEKHNNANKKEDHDTSGHYKNVPINGDVSPIGNGISNHRASDAVSCWGDVPKRQTRLIDLFSDVDEGSNTNNRTSMNHGATLVQRSSDRYNTNDTHRNSTKSTYSTRSKATTSTFGDSKTTSSDEVKSNQNKSTNGTGRERLLEWLRTSQAKRDENNRQVFTRWIDRIESMNNHETVAANLSSAAALAATATANIGTTGPMDFSHGPVFAQPFPGTANVVGGASFPGLLTTPTFLIGNPMGIMSTSNASLVNPHATKSSVPYHNPILTNPYMSNLLTGKATPVNNLSYLTTVMPNLINVPPGPSNIPDGSHPETIPSSPKDTEANPMDSGSQSVGNTLCNSYGSDTSVTNNASASGTACDNVLTSKPNGPNSTDSVGQGQSQIPLNPVYFPSSTPLGTIDSSLLPGAIQPPSYYVPMPVMNDPLSSNMYYYYCYQNHLTNNTVTPNSNMNGAAGGVGKTMPMTQPPLLYYIPSPGTQPALPTPSHSVYVPDSCMCLPTYPNMVDPASYEMGGRRVDTNNDSTLETSSSLFTPVIPLASGNMSMGSDSKTSGLLNLSNTESHSANTTNKLGTNGSVIATEPSTNEIVDGESSQSSGAMEFDVKKWYSVLHDITSSPNSEGQLGSKATKKIGSLLSPNSSAQPLIAESVSVGKKLQAGGI